MTSARDLALELKQANPEIRIGHAKGTAVGYYSQSRWWPYAIKALGDKWVRVPFIPRANGEDCYKQGDWIEVKPALGGENG